MSKNLEAAYAETTTHLQELYAKRDQLNVQIDDVMAMRGVLGRVIAADAKDEAVAQAANQAGGSPSA